MAFCRFLSLSFAIAVLATASRAAEPEVTPAALQQVQDAFTYPSFTYQGRLRLGGAPLNGTCDLQLSLWDAVAGGVQVGVTQTILNVPVSDGLFTVLLSAGQEFGANPFPGAARWLQTSVRSPAGAGGYTLLAPRQALTPEPWALGLRPGALIVGSNQTILSAVTDNGGGNASALRGQLGATPSSATGSGGVWGDANRQNTAGVLGTSQSYYGVYGTSAAGGAGIVGVIGNTFSSLDAGERAGVWGLSNVSAGDGVRGDGFNGGHGVRGRASGTSGAGVVGETFGGSSFAYGVHGVSHGNGTGVLGLTEATTGTWAGVSGTSVAASGRGTEGFATHTTGVNYGIVGSSASPNGFGGSFTNSSADGTALFATGSGSGKDKAVLRVQSSEVSCGIAVYATTGSNCAAGHYANFGTGQVFWLQNGGDANGVGGGDFITCVNEAENDAQFRVTSSGQAFSDVGFNTPAADFAEMLPASDGLEPGEVLAIGSNGKLERTTEAYQATVVGVRSTRPGFVGGYDMDGNMEGRVPLAMVGIVPVKASAENGSIHAGDLLVASATPGHCMRGEGVEKCFGRTIGKALSSLEGGTGTIQVLILQR